MRAHLEDDMVTVVARSIATRIPRLRHPARKSQRVRLGMFWTWIYFRCRNLDIVLWPPPSDFKEQKHGNTFAAACCLIVVSWEGDSAIGANMENLCANRFRDNCGKFRLGLNLLNMALYSLSFYRGIYANNNCSSAFILLNYILRVDLSKPWIYNLKKKSKLDWLTHWLDCFSRQNVRRMKLSAGIAIRGDLFSFEKIVGSHICSLSPIMWLG